MAAANTERDSTITPGAQSIVAQSDRQNSIYTSRQSTFAGPGAPRNTMIDSKKSKRFLKRFLKSKRGALMPTGLLALHIKTLHLGEIDVYSMFQRYDVCVYIRVTVSGTTKYSSLYSRVKLPMDLVFDELKHFRIVASDVRGDNCNNVKIELVFLDPTQRDEHHIICAKEFHVYESMKELFEVKHLELRDFNKQKPVGELIIETCFAYGTFGFGFGNQFSNKPSNPKDNINHSIFFRPHPPDDRWDYENDVTTCHHVGHPSIIPFTESAQLDMYAQFEFDTDSVANEDSNRLIHTRMHGRVSCLKDEINRLSNRKERMQFLRCYLFTNDSTIPISHDTFRLKPGFTLKDRSPKIPGQEGDINVDDAETFQLLAQAAPGLTKRREDHSGFVLPKSVSALSKGITTAARKVTVSVGTFLGHVKNMGGLFTHTQNMSEKELTANEKTEIDHDRLKYSMDDRRYSWHI